MKLIIVILVSAIAGYVLGVKMPGIAERFGIVRP